MTTNQGVHSLVRVYLLGRFETRVGDRVIIDRAWGRRKAGALLKLLALQPVRSLHRERIQDILWPELDPDAATNNLHKSLHYLRAALGETGRSCLTLSSDVVSLTPEVWIDTDAFRTLARRGRSAANDPAQYEEALALYVGDVLPEDLYEDWTAAARDELRTLRHQLLFDVAQVYEARGEDERAIERLQQLVAADPLHEAGHRVLMRLYARLGRRHDALRLYHLCREALNRELGIEPSEETETLQRRILDGGDGLRLEPNVAVGTPLRAGTHRRSELPSLYGRDRELELVDESLAAAAGAEVRTLFIHGSAGIGKSRLAEQALAMAEEVYGAMTLVGRSHELDEPISYRPLRDMLRQAVMVVDHQPAQDILRSSLHLKRLLGGGSPATLTATDPALLQLELFDEVIRFLTALAAPNRPLVLLFEDMHAADEASLRALHHLCRALPQMRCAVAVLATYRPEEAAKEHRLLLPLLGDLRRDRLVREVTLAPLDEPAMRLVVEQHFHSEPVDRDLVDLVVSRAEGNPFFAGELARTLVADSYVQFSQGRWRRKNGVEVNLPVPGAIHDLLDRRLERLGDAARQVLQVAAILGQDIDYGLLRRLVPLAERDILDGLDECLQAGVLEETTTGYRYRHGLLREAAHARLTRARRQRLHRAVGEVLCELGSAEPAEVGAHFAESDEPWRAVLHLHAAARSAASVFDNRPAIELYDRALAIARANPAHVDQGDLAIFLEEMGDLVRRTGDAPHATSLFEEALGHLTASEDAERVFRVRGKVALGHIVSGKAQVAGDLLGDTLQTLAAPDRPDSVAQTYYLLAHLRWHSGQYDEALAAAEKAHLAAQASGDISQQARAYEALALACHARGDWQKGVEYELSRQELAAPGFDVDDALDVHL